MTGERQLEPFTFLLHLAAVSVSNPHAAVRRDSTCISARCLSARSSVLQCCVHGSHWACIGEPASSPSVMRIFVPPQIALTAGASPGTALDIARHTLRMKGQRRSALRGVGPAYGGSGGLDLGLHSLKRQTSASASVVSHPPPHNISAWA